MKLDKLDRQTWVVRTVSLIVFLNGLLAIDRPLAEHLPERIEAVVTPVNIDFASRSLNLMLGLILVYVAVQLLQRKVAAWWIGTTAAGLLVVSHLAAHHATNALLIPLLSLVALIVVKDYFRARSEIIRVRNGVIIFGISIALALAYGTLGFWLMDRRDFGTTFGFMESLTRSLREFLLIGNADLQSHSRRALWFLYSIRFLGAGSVAYGLYSLFRPIAYVQTVRPAELERVKQLLETGSNSSDDFFKIWPNDKSYFFSQSGGATAYGVKAGVALAVGDPVGAASQVKESLKEFGEHCLRHGWTPAFVYIGASNLGLYDDSDYDVLKVGEDAVISLEHFSQITSKNKHFRNIRNRFDKDGYSLKVSTPPHSKELLREISEVSADWMKQPDRQEWGFLAGSFSRRYMDVGPVFVVKDEKGRTQAFANQIPTYLKGYATIDLMRYRQSAPKGIMDWLLLAVFEELHNLGYQKFNLGLAPLSGLAEGKTGPEEKLLDLIYKSNQKFLSLQGLRQFKDKFEPSWESRYIAYRGGVGRLPRIAYALNKLIRIRKK